MKGQLIYSQRFELPWLIESFSNDNESGLSADEAHRYVEELSRHLEEDSIYILIPHRLALAKKLIQFAKAFSEQEEIDIDIIKNPYDYQATFYIFGTQIIADMKNSLGHLFLMSDEVEIKNSKNKKDWYQFAVTFYLRTHRHVIDGRTIDFYDSSN